MSHKLRLALALAAALAAGCATKGSIKVIAPVPRPTPAPEAESVAAPLAATVTAAPAAREATVLRGDSFWRVARREMGSGTRYAELADFNHLTPESLIRSGDTLKIPTGSVRAGSPGYRVSQTERAPSKKAKPRADTWPRRPNRAYAVGEKLTFAVQYFTATAGYAILTIKEYATQQGRVCMHVVAEAKTHPFFETFFKVRDRIDSFIDADALFSWRYEKHLREGGYSADASYTFDQRAGMMYEPDKGKSVTTSAEVQDALSCFFWFRTMDLTPGSDTHIKVAADDMKTYDLRIKVLRKEHVSTLAGEFDCILVQPFLTFEGIFQHKGDFFVWITDDERRLPVKVQSQIAIGSININLQEAEWVKPE